MNPLTVSIALTGAFLCASPALLQSGKERPREAPEVAAAPLVKDLQGAWKLVEFETKVLRRDRRQEVGYLLVSGEYLSFECHLGWMDDSGKRDASTFFSGTHSFVLRADSTLVMTSLIGSTVDPTGSAPMFEQPGRKREYKVQFDGSKLVLVRELDQQTFRFERQAQDPALDFYGRKKKPAPLTEPPPPRDGEKKKE